MMKNLIIGAIYAFAVSIANPDLNMSDARWYLVMVIIILADPVVNWIYNG